MIPATVSLFVVLPRGQSIDSARLLPKKCGNNTCWVVDISFDHTFRPQDHFQAQIKDNYFVIDVFGIGEKPTRIPLSKVCVYNSSVQLHILSGVSFPNDKIYHIYLRNITFSGRTPNKPLQRKLDISRAQDNLGGKSRRWTVQKTKKRHNSDIQISGNLHRPSGGGAVGSADIRVAGRYSPKQGDYIVDPGFDLKWSSDVKSDADMVNFWCRHRLHVGRKFSQPKWKKLFASSWLFITPKIESDRGFNNTGLIGDIRWLVFSKSIISKKLIFEPYVGLEVGRRLIPPSMENSSQVLTRPLIRLDIVTAPLYRGTSLKTIRLEGKWYRRWPLTNEAIYETLDDQSISAVRIGRGPQDYVSAKLTLESADFFDFYLGYEYGQLPPRFKFVDQRVELGMRLLMDLIRK